MAYRAPRYSYLHALRDRASITYSHSQDPDFPRENLYDDRAGTLYKFAASVADPFFRFDLGSDFSTAGWTGLNRLIIPANHNIDEILIKQADDTTFLTNVETLHSESSITNGVLYDTGTFNTQAQDRRHVQVQFVGTKLYYMPQIVLTKIETLTVGPALARSLDGYIDNVTRLEQLAGLTPTIKHGPQQRVLEYEYEAPLTGTDLTKMEELIAAVGMEKPFWIDPASFSTPPEDDEPALWVKFSEMPRSNLAVDVPMSGTRGKTFTLRMVESVD